jgi:hypothetical protein
MAAKPEDPAPVGFVSLRIAFQRFHGRASEPLDDQQLIGRFLRYLENGTLCAEVLDPQTHMRFAIPREAWRGDWVGRPLFFSRILGIESDDFKPYAGRTPFVPEAQLSAIISGVAQKSSRERHPWAKCREAFFKTVEEMGGPTVDGGEDGWRTQADVERWIGAWMAKRLGREPGEATIRRRARTWLGELASQGSIGS